MIRVVSAPPCRASGFAPVSRNDPSFLSHPNVIPAAASGIAIQHLARGHVQPAAGALADRFGCRRVITVDALTCAPGFALKPLATIPLGFRLSAGALV